MMAKIPFSKLGTKVDNEVVLLHWGEYEIEIKKYLPMSDKAEMVSKIVNLSLDSNGYYNPLKVKVYLTLRHTTGQEMKEFLNAIIHSL